MGIGIQVSDKTNELLLVISVCRMLSTMVPWHILYAIYVTKFMKVLSTEFLWHV